MSKLVKTAKPFRAANPPRERKPTNASELPEEVIYDTISKTVPPRKKTSNLNLIEYSLPGSPNKPSEGGGDYYIFQSPIKSAFRDKFSLKLERELKSELIGRIMVALGHLKKYEDDKPFHRAKELRPNQQLPFEFDILDILKVFRSKNKDNLIIKMDAAEVVTLCNVIGQYKVKKFLELLFPVLNTETQYDLVKNYDFMSSNDDPLDEDLSGNLFNFILSIPRSEIREFMCKAYNPLLLLKYIKFKLEEESPENNRGREIEPEESFAMELLYLFNDFLVNDYAPVYIGDKVQRICSDDCVSSQYLRRRKRTDLSYQSDNTSNLGIPIVDDDGFCQD